MAISVRFAAEPTSREKYDEVKKRLEDAGDWTPPGLIFHEAQGDSDVEEVFEVWESREAFESFGATLMPLLDEVGINAGEPQVREVYSLDKP
jgi:quinol monooxygenase YgiN